MQVLVILAFWLTAMAAGPVIGSYRHRTGVGFGLAILLGWCGILMFLLFVHRPVGTGSEGPQDLVDYYFNPCRRGFWDPFSLP